MSRQKDIRNIGFYLFVILFQKTLLVEVIVNEVSFTKDLLYQLNVCTEKLRYEFHTKCMELKWNL